MGSSRIVVLSVLTLLITACSAQFGSLPKRGPFSAECREGGADHGNAEKCGLFGGLFSGGGGGGASMGGKNISGLNWAGALERINSLPSRSRGMCAQGTRYTLNRLFGGQKSSHPNAACKYTADTFNRNWPVTSSGTRVTWTQSGGSVYPGCVNICKRRGVACGGSKGTAGHSEIYSSAGWSSDFKQRGSVCAGASYEGTRTYCPRQAGGLAMSSKSLQKIISTFFTLSLLHASDVPEGHSAEAVEKDTKAVAKQLREKSKTYTVVVKNGSYELQVRELPEPGESGLDDYTIFKKGKIEPIVDRDQSNAFAAILVKDDLGKFMIPENIRKELALNYVLKLIEVHGLKEMEVRTRNITHITAFQRDAYLDAQKIHPSLKLPENPAPTIIPE